MTYRQIYETPPDFDDILLTSDGGFLTGLCFLGSKAAAKNKLTRCKWCNENNPPYVEYHDRECFLYKSR